jgi:branched-chain amino acid transport system substrate-binding protein
MNSMLRRITFCLLMSIGSLVPAGCARKNVSDPIQIGHIAPLSGPDRAVGEHAERGISLAVEEVNKADDRLLGRPVNVHHVDTRGDSAAVKPIAIRLATVNKVAALLLGIEASQVEDLALVAQDYKVPMIVPGELPGRMTSEYVFHTGMRAAHQGEVLARFVTEEPLKATRILVVTAAPEVSNQASAPASPAAGSKPRAPTNDNQGRRAAATALFEAFVTELHKHGGKLAGEKVYRTAADAKDIVEQVQKDRPDALLVAGSAADLVALHNAGLDDKLPILLGGPEGAFQGIEDVDLPNPIYRATVFVSDSSAAAREFATRYRDHFGDAPDVHAALAYDNARLVFEAMRQAKAVDGTKVQAALAGLKDFNSVTGPLSFKEQWASRTVFIIRLRKGKAETVKHYDP